MSTQDSLEKVTLEFVEACWCCYGSKHDAERFCMFCAEGRDEARWVEARTTELQMCQVWVVISAWSSTWNEKLGEFIGYAVRSVFSELEAFRVRMEASLKLYNHRRAGIAKFFETEESKIGEMNVIRQCALRTLKHRMLAGSKSTLLVA